MISPQYRHGLLLAAASGLALATTFSPYGGPVLPFLAFTPLTVALILGRQTRPGASFTFGFTTAAIAHGIGLYWISPALWWRTSLAVPINIILLVLIGLLAGAACAAATTLTERKRWPLPVSLAACWVGFEWATAHLPGFSYAWLNAGMSLAWYPSLAAGVELLGARWLSLWTVGFGAGAGLLVARHWQKARGVRSSVCLLAALGTAVLLFFLIGHSRNQMFTDGEPVARVAAVQLGRSETTPASELAYWTGELQALAQEEAQPFDLVAFPEGFLAEPPDQQVRDAAESLGVPMLIGATELTDLDATTSANQLRYNTAFLVHPDGTFTRQRKSRLVPGLESSPWWASPLFGPQSQGYAAGSDLNPLPFLTVAGTATAVGVMICYDSAFGDVARGLRRAGAQWLAVLSDDDWLDPDAPLTVTWAYWQHATHGRLRAIENRISLVQVGRTGYTFTVQPGGRADFTLAPGATGTTVFPVMATHPPTVFTKVGDVLGLACFIVLVCGYFVHHRSWGGGGSRARARAAATAEAGP